ncbi:ABC transporter substrate-binding protein [Hydrogenophaga laconesensis]|uniref:Branched-chain amino acid transport system substrate-binding protein n=1 Tax=Hydrogenophaga laconesensis TaxID=1805971 RepID=A0ABU1VBC1_9BURK|nr:ABC transporter substrate-binding protein [Hydrogenophaga laconesensis]MDR7094764.1 branched-chain amino acid transport system substrate-binding protein [Hydrogenophaga laconesensis]
MRTLRSWAVRTATLAGLLVSAALPSTAQTVYQVPAMSDFSGPFSSIMPMMAGGREAVATWWNTEVGAKMGVKVELKSYDTRYDAAQTASLWPGVLATKPLVGLSAGGPDTAALQQRLPTDKVVMISGSAANGSGWRPNQWVLTPRPTFVHEIAGFIEWYQKTKTPGRPLKAAMFTTEASPSFADMAKGVAAYAKAKPNVVNLVEMVFVDVQPTDVTLQLRRVLNAGAEVILVPTNIQQAVAVKRAMQALGKNVPIVHGLQNSPGMLQKLVGSMAAMEGDYEMHGGVITSDEENDAKKFYDMLVAKHGMKVPWHAITSLGMTQTLLALRAVEVAAKKHGPDKLTGEHIHSAMLETTFPAKDFFGLTGGDLDFSVEAPFPTKDPRINIGQVVGGKLVTVAKGVPVPQLAKW